MKIRKTFHDIVRLRHILRVLIEYGFGYLVARLEPAGGLIGLRRRGTGLRRFDMPLPVRLRKVLEALGPTFVKLGQVLSMRPDLLAPDMIAELEKLQDEVPPFEFAAVRDGIERELGRPLGSLFSSFDPVPIASASLAQVHGAALLTGETVVVKVQRPHIAEIISADIDLLYELARLAERYIEESRLFNPVGLVDEFSATIAREIDFVNEAFNVDRFRNQFRDDPTVLIPKVYHQYSGRRVLTLEWIKGIKITDIEGIRAAGLAPVQLAKNGADAILKMVFITGFFHADPHPGNILAMEKNRVAFPDFGMVGRITDRLRSRLSDILVSVTRRDIPEIRDAFLAVGTPEKPVDIDRLDMDLYDFVDRYYGKPLKELNIGYVLLNLIDIVSRHRIRLPSDLFLLSKVLITIDGIGRRLDPGFNMVEEARPFVERLQEQRYNPVRIARDLRKFTASFARFGRALPKDLSDIFNKLKQGTLRVEFEHMGLEELTAQIGRASSRIALSLIIAALIVGSSIVLNARIGPYYFGLPLLGLVGFVLAAVMGVWLVIVILSSREV
jgi:ubiquinone biosynthesis protein